MIDAESRLHEIEAELRYFDGETPLTDDDRSLLLERNRLYRQLRCTDAQELGGEFPITAPCNQRRIDAAICRMGC